MRKKILAGLMSTALLCSLIPASYSLINNESSSFFSVDGAEAVSTVVYSTGFEDGINDFTGRGGVETLQIVNTDSYSGTNCLECSNRGKGWHGPWLALEGLLEPGIEYMVSAKAKAQWYNNINLKLDYTDSSGQRHYVDILSAVSQGDWVEMNDGKFIIPNNVTNVYLYFECNDTANMYIDDFEIKTAPVYEIQHPTCRCRPWSCPPGWPSRYQSRGSGRCGAGRKCPKHGGPAAPTRHIQSVYGTASYTAGCPTAGHPPRNSPAGSRPPGQSGPRRPAQTGGRPPRRPPSPQRRKWGYRPGSSRPLHWRSP